MADQKNEKCHQNKVEYNNDEKQSSAWDHQIQSHFPLMKDQTPWMKLVPFSKNLSMEMAQKVALFYRQEQDWKECERAMLLDRRIRGFGPRRPWWKQVHNEAFRLMSGPGAHFWWFFFQTSPCLTWTHKGKKHSQWWSIEGQEWTNCLKEWCVRGRSDLMVWIRDHWGDLLDHAPTCWLQHKQAQKIKKIHRQRHWPLSTMNRFWCRYGQKEAFIQWWGVGKTQNHQEAQLKALSSLRWMDVMMCIEQGHLDFVEFLFEARKKMPFHAMPPLKNAWNFLARKQASKRKWGWSRKMHETCFFMMSCQEVVEKHKEDGFLNGDHPWKDWVWKWLIHADDFNLFNKMLACKWIEPVPEILDELLRYENESRLGGVWRAWKEKEYLTKVMGGMGDEMEEKTVKRL